MNNIYYSNDHILVETPTTTWAILGTTWETLCPERSDDDLRTMTDEDFEQYLVGYGSPKGFFEVE